MIEREGVCEDLARIDLPTLIIVGNQDVATPPDLARRVHRRIEAPGVVKPGVCESAPKKRQFKSSILYNRRKMYELLRG